MCDVPFYLLISMTLCRHRNGYLPIERIVIYRHDLLIYGGGESNKSITAYKLVFSPKIDSLLNMIYVRMDRMKNDLSIHSIALNQCGVLFKCKEQNFGRCSGLKISLKMCELDSFLEPSRQVETRFQTATWFITTLTSSSAPLVMWLLRHACVIYNPECFPAVTLSSVRVSIGLSLSVLYIWPSSFHQ